MDTKKYIVTLTPHDKFFFGGEKSFGQKNSDSNTNYLVKSNYFPQQTGVLGFVRHQLLLQCNDEEIFKNNKIQSKEKAKNLIGAQSFRTDKDKEFNFGKISSISPIFICNKEDYYFPLNKEYQYNKEDDKYQLLEVALENIPELEEYKPKKGLNDLFVNKKDQIITYDAVFSEQTQVGIRKKYEGGTDDAAYYIQTFLKFKETFAFSFIVELGKNTIFGSKNIAIFGGEQQAFKMEVKECNTSFNELLPSYKSSKNADKVILTSDTFVEKDIIEECDFAITETINFRFLETDTEKEGNYYREPLKSKRFNLYKKGSVFYGEIAKIEKLLTNNKFNKLGYNHFKSILKNQ